MKSWKNQLFSCEKWPKLLKINNCLLPWQQAKYQPIIVTAVISYQSTSTMKGMRKIYFLTVANPTQ